MGKKIKLPVKGASYGSLSFSSSRKDVVSVSGKGILRGISAGRAVITVRNRATGEVVGSVKVTSRAFRAKAPAVVALYPGQSRRVISDVSKSDLACSSSKGKVAAVSNSGVVTARAKGSCSVKVRLRGGSTVGRVKVKVLKSHVKFVKGKKTLEHGSTVRFKAKSKRYKASSLRFSSSNREVAKVSKKGKVTALTPGYATITVKAPDGCIAKRKFHVTAEHGQLTRAKLDATGAAGKPKLMIVAHPDDETLWGGAHMMDGDWYIVCLTNGGHAVRKSEFADVLAASGCSGVILTYPDKVGGQRSNWLSVASALREDFDTLFRYKDWAEIATYNPDGVTGHIHHKLTYSYTKTWCERYGMFDRLYYYGHFYGPGKVPAGLARLTEPRLSQKWALVGLYQREAQSIASYWAQMVPYENWIKASEW